jgi:hypothetical protein
MELLLAQQSLQRLSRFQSLLAFLALLHVLPDANRSRRIQLIIQISVEKIAAFLTVHS